MKNLLSGIRRGTDLDVMTTADLQRETAQAIQDNLCSSSCAGALTHPNECSCACRGQRHGDLWSRDVWHDVVMSE